MNHTETVFLTLLKSPSSCVSFEQDCQYHA